MPELLALLDALIPHRRRRGGPSGEDGSVTYVSLRKKKP